MTMVASNLTYPYGPLIKRHMQYKLRVEGEWSFPCEDMFEILNPSFLPLTLLHISWQFNPLMWEAI